MKYVPYIWKKYTRDSWHISLECDYIRYMQFAKRCQHRENTYQTRLNGGIMPYGVQTYS